jgi:hypothetical protein
VDPWCALGALVRRLGVDLVWTNTTYLEFTPTMLKHKLETRIEVVRDYDRSLPRYGMLESARSIHRPSVGLLPRPTPGRNRGGRTIEPALRAGRAFARNRRKPTCGCAAISVFGRR